MGICKRRPINRIRHAYTVEGLPVQLERDQIELSLVPGWNPIAAGWADFNLTGISTDAVAWYDS